jgi:FlaA1/EpsC-like NDP-sugar epimerase
MSTLELGLLAIILSALVYYLTYDNICPHEKGPFLGSPLRTPSSKLHVLVTGGAGYIGSHAAQRLLKDGHSVTVIDNLSRGNVGAVNVLKQLADPGRFQFIKLDLGDHIALKQAFKRCHFDLVMHFAAVAYVGEASN